MKTPKYVLWTDHRTGFNHLDDKIAMASDDIIDAMNETRDIVLNDDNLYCVCMFERCGKTDIYTQILRSNDNGYSFMPECSMGCLKRYTSKMPKKYGGNTFQYFEFEF